MTESQELQSEIENLLKHAAENLKIRKYKTNFDAGGAIRGGGFIGEFFLASIVDEETQKVHEVAIKKAFSKEQNRREFNSSLAYECEVRFYSKVFPAFKKFQMEKNVTDPFTEVADFYYGTLEEYKEGLVFENLKAHGYIARETKLLLDDELATSVFKTYGKFHALSFAFKDQRLEEYKRIMKGAVDYVDINFRTGATRRLIDSAMTEAFEALLDSHPEIKVLSEKFLTDATGEMLKHIKYHGNAIVVHGDCWCSNRLYKYSESGKLLGVKLVDFQLMREGTPVFDLSYFFYAGGNKELFKKLDHYLKIYYDSFSKNLKELGSDPEKLYPFKQLKEEWIQYGMYGMILGVCLAKFKLLESDDVQEIVKDHDDDGTEAPMVDNFLSANIDKNLFHQRSKDIILHAYEIGLLK